jgi:endonuclease/exonuclease/phosphatase family metal-dependent hydrolase
MRLTVMTYNLRAAHTPAGLEGVARVIERQAPDLVGAQELDRNWARTGYVDQPAWLAERLGLHAVFAPAVHPAPGAEYGLALLARWPIGAWEIRLLARGADETSPRGRQAEQRVVLLARVQVPGGPRPAVVVTHFELIAATRLIQAGQLVAWANEWAAGDPLIVMGDFNAEFGSPEIERLCGAFTHTWRARPGTASDRAPYHTFPSGPAGSRTDDGWCGGIDHIFLGPGWTVQSCRVAYDETRASDHQPAVARIRLQGIMPG